MTSAAAFYVAMLAWLSHNGFTNFKLSGVMELHKAGGMRQFSASLVPDKLSNSTIEEPEEFEYIFRNGSPNGFVLMDIATGEFYSEHVVMKPNWRIQLTYMSCKCGSGCNKSEVELARRKRSYDRPNVEIAKGVFKYVPPKSQPNMLKMRLNYLLRLKKNMEHE